MTAKAKVHTAGKPAKGAKPARPPAHHAPAHAKQSGKAAPKSGTHATAKHAPAHTKTTTKGGKKPVAKKRGLAVGDWLPVCALEAVAMSLRLAGQPVSGDEVAWLWELAGGAPAGATVAAALDAASLHGLAGFRPELAVDLGTGCLAPVGAADHLALPSAQDEAVAVDPFEHFIAGHALILGVDVPGPHCVLATPAGWWSWGQLWDPWPCRIEEALAVSWA